MRHIAVPTLTCALLLGFAACGQDSVQPVEEDTTVTVTDTSAPPDVSATDTSAPDTTPSDTVPPDTTTSDDTSAQDTQADTTPVDVEADTTPDTQADTAPADTGPPPCVPTDPPDEVCDGVDNDCDGAIDNDVICDDGVACTEGDQCVDGACVPGEAVCPLCSESGECEDGLVCDGTHCIAPCIPPYAKCLDEHTQIRCTENLLYEEIDPCFVGGKCVDVDYLGIQASRCPYYPVAGDVTNDTLTVYVSKRPLDETGQAFKSWEPAESAFVIVGADPNTPHQGLTDAEGKIVFAGVPPTNRDVTVAMKGYVARTIVGMEGDTYYALINEIWPPEGYEPPIGDEPNTVSGTVSGLPAPAEGMAARCQWHSENADTAVDVAEDGTYEITHPGPGARTLVCYSGVPEEDGKMTPVTVGFRKLLAGKPTDLSDIDVTLDNTLGSSVKVRLESPLGIPGLLDILGTDFFYAAVSLDFGIYGTWSIPTATGFSWTPTQSLEVPRIPNTLEGKWAEVSLAVWGGSFSTTNSNAPNSYASRRQVPLALGSGVSQAGATLPVPDKTLNALWTGAEGSAWAVGDGGHVGRRVNGEWEWMSTPQDDDLVLVHAFGPDQMVAVGESKTIWTYSAGAWSSDDQTLEPPTINVDGEMWGSSADDLILVGGWGTPLRFDGKVWEKEAVLGNWRAVHGGEGLVVIAGHFGAVARKVGDGDWTKDVLPDPLKSLNYFGVFVKSASEAYIVGQEGTILLWNGEAWSAMETPTTEELTTIRGDAEGNVMVLSTSGTFLTLEAGEWVLANTSAPEGYAVSAFELEAEGPTLLLQSVIDLGPLVDTWTVKSLQPNDTLFFNEAPEIVFEKSQDIAFGGYTRFARLGVPTLFGNRALWIIDAGTQHETVTLPAINCLAGWDPGVSPTTGVIHTFNRWMDGPYVNQPNALVPPLGYMHYGASEPLIVTFDLGPACP